MKPRNALVLTFAALLLIQLLVKECYMEGYPMVTLPGGASKYEHETDTITVLGWRATAYSSESDSMIVDGNVLFPRSRHHWPLYSSLVSADTSSNHWGEASQWIKKNITNSTPLAEPDSICVHRVEHGAPAGRSAPVGEQNTEIQYVRSTCYSLSSDR
jgi:hypothetical protein